MKARLRPLAPISRRSRTSASSGARPFCSHQPAYDKITRQDTVEGVHVCCFPDLYKALSGNPPDQVISL